MESQKKEGGDQVKVIRESALPTTTFSNGQDTFTQSGKEVQQELSPNIKHILIVDDDPDITLTFKKGLEQRMKRAVIYFLKSVFIMIP